jgi:hypothetical protein
MRPQVERRARVQAACLSFEQVAGFVEVEVLGGRVDDVELAVVCWREVCGSFERAAGVAREDGGGEDAGKRGSGHRDTSATGVGLGLP